jgi:hypothetical protein
MKKIIAISLLCLLIGCREKGEYQYIIYMKDGTQVKAWSVDSEGGGLIVYPKYDQINVGYYHLSSNEYTKAVFIGLKTDSL